MGNCDICHQQQDFDVITSQLIEKKILTHKIKGQIETLKGNNHSSLEGIKSVKTKDGSFYRGTLVGGKKEGYGELIVRDFVYYGAFKNDLPHGKGSITSADQAYFGDFKEGLAHGEGIESTQEYKFEGTFREGNKVKGTYTSQAITYEGLLKNNKFDGRGKLTQQKNGLKEHQYYGQFKNGKFHGKGNLKCSNGSSVVGHFKEGKLQGYGQFTWPNAKYKGLYHQGRRHGYGTLKVAQTQYSGQWHNGHRKGKAIISNPETGQMGFGDWNHDVLIEPIFE